MKVLNLYSGLGGNRKNWINCKVTAIENNLTVAKYYLDNYPNDTVYVTDAHEYLLEHYKEFDFIWSSPPYPSHSRARFWTSKGGKYDVVYPDLKLYEEILFLKHYFQGKWVVENVKPFYKPLIPYSIEIERHLFWSNFTIYPFVVPKNKIFDGNIGIWQKEYGIDISNYKFDIRKDKLLRNCVHPGLGLHIFNCFEKTKEERELFKNK